MGDSHHSLYGALSTISRLTISRLTVNLSQAKERMKGLETAKSSQVSGAIITPSQGAHENEGEPTISSCGIITPRECQNTGLTFKFQS
jgi:hypothetical protein